MKRRKKNRLSKDMYITGCFFVTINVQDRMQCLGTLEKNHDISQGVFVDLSEQGKIVQQQRLRLETQYPYVRLGEYIIMPDHMHGVIYIDDICSVGTGENVGMVRDLPLHDIPKRKGLSSLIGAFKTTSSKLIHQGGYDTFKRQRSFHDRIICSEQILFYVQRYIKNNPRKWIQDRY